MKWSWIQVFMMTARALSNNAFKIAEHEDNKHPGLSANSQSCPTPDFWFWCKAVLRESSLLTTYLSESTLSS